MFVGAFNGSVVPLLEESHLVGERWKGMACSAEALCYADDLIEVFFFGHLYLKSSHEESQVSNDAQFVAQIYRREGTAAFAQLDGSFTFVLRTAQELIVVRDHHGTQAQVYYNETHFASSLHLLQQTQGCSRSVNRAALATFLSVGYIPTGSSAFERITKLGAGSMLVVSEGKQQRVNLFETSLIVPSTEVWDLDEAAHEYSVLHAEAIRRRVGKSNRVGILLSGGYDSGCNLAALREQYAGDIYSFSIGFKGDTWSELPLAQCMSDEFGTIHRQYEIDGSEVNALPEIVRELGDPFVEGGLMVNYAAMLMVGDLKPDVILGGDGNDQYFGTSGREVAMHYLAARYGLKPLLELVHGVLSRPRFDHNNTPYRIRFHLSKILRILDGDLFGFESFQLRELLQDPGVLRDLRGCGSGCGMGVLGVDTRSFDHLYTQHAYASDLEKIINQVILFKASRMAMMFDNRIEFPFMDLDIYHFLQRLPVHFKCRGEGSLRMARGRSTAKFLLKYHYKPMLPTAITTKKKQGGFAPMPLFFKEKSQRRRMADFILSSSVVGDFLRRDSVESFIRTYDQEAEMGDNWFWYKQNKAIQFFNLLTLSIWWEQYVKGNAHVTL